MVFVKAQFSNAFIQLFIALARSVQSI